jgi:hypothetical protein
MIPAGRFLQADPRSGQLACSGSVIEGLEIHVAQVTHEARMATSPERQALSRGAAFHAMKLQGGRDLQRPEKAAGGPCRHFPTLFRPKRATAG